MQNEQPPVTDEQLAAEAKKQKASALTYAVFIGFLIGIIIYSVIKNSWGFLTLIPLFLIYKLLNHSKQSNG